MAPGDVVPDHAKPLKSKEKRPGNRPLKAECEPDGSFVFEAHEAWKEFHNSLRHFYEVGELCDVTLKVGQSVLHLFFINTQTKRFAIEIVFFVCLFLIQWFFCFCRLAAG